MNEKENNRRTYYLEVNGSKVYFNYNEDMQVCKRGGRSVMISKEKFCDFLHTANELGFNAGEV